MIDLLQCSGLHNYTTCWGDKSITLSISLTDKKACVIAIVAMYKTYIFIGYVKNKKIFFINIKLLKSFRQLLY